MYQGLDRETPLARRLAGNDDHASCVAGGPIGPGRTCVSSVCPCFCVLTEEPVVGRGTRSLRLGAGDDPPPGGTAAREGPDHRVPAGDDRCADHAGRFLTAHDEPGLPTLRSRPARTKELEADSQPPPG